MAAAWDPWNQTSKSILLLNIRITKQTNPASKPYPSPSPHVAAERAHEYHIPIPIPVPNIMESSGLRWHREYDLWVGAHQGVAAT